LKANFPGLNFLSETTQPVIIHVRKLPGKSGHQFCFGNPRKIRTPILFLAWGGRAAAEGFRQMLLRATWVPACTVHHYNTAISPPPLRIVLITDEHYIYLQIPEWTFYHYNTTNIFVMNIFLQIFVSSSAYY